MDCTISNGKIIFKENGCTYSFDAHGEFPRPSIFPAISVGGSHLSDRSDDTKLEKHISVQDAAVGDGYAAWYTQEFIPDGQDYKLSKNAKIYLGDFSSGKEKIIYKGECYGDLCFDGKDLYFNMGNKVTVYHIDTEETEILFKHSNMKKNCIDLHITPKRIFYTHWTHNNFFCMWYDRETKEIVNPHFDNGTSFFLDDETIIFHGGQHTWLYDVSKMKKKRFFSNKAETGIIDTVLAFFDIPEKYFEKYHSSWTHIRLESFENNRLYFYVHASYHTNGSFDEKQKEAHSFGLPTAVMTDISCGVNGKDIMIEADKNDIVREESEYNSFFKHDFPLDFPDLTFKARRKKE